MSDIDDTTKITNVGSIPAAVVNGFCGKKVFVGMPELYQELTRRFSTDVEFHKRFLFPMVFLSGGPTALLTSLHDMLIGQNGFPEAQILLRNWDKDPGVQIFKTRKLSILSKITGLPLLLFGDDTEHDPEAFADLAAQNPRHGILQRYIHRVVKKERPLPPGTTPYYTAFDVALMEVEAGRLSTAQAVRVGEAILNGNAPERLFPDFARCPTELSYELGPIGKQDPRLEDVRLRVGLYATEYCQKRDSL